MRKWLWKLILALGIVLFAYFVWPTPWIYFCSGDGTMIRVNRFTHVVAHWNIQYDCW